MPTISNDLFLRCIRFILVLSLITACVHVLDVLFDTGYVTGRSLRLPANTVTLQLNLTRPHRNFIQDIAEGATDGWRAGGSGSARVRRPAPFVPDSVAPRFNAAGFELLTNTNQQVLRYQERSFGKRLSLLWLGASHTTMGLGAAVALAGIVWQLWLLVRGVTPAAPFTQANARRLRWIALLILGWAVWQEVAHALLLVLLPDFPAPHLPLPLARYVELTGDAQTPNLWAISVLGVIALIYRRGVELQQEAELTV
ncbi:DUF2975 domain-containing protein [Hymenobacter sediminis]|uniref:DUF2975 domain-containing protein n=1 Tax=Hymenobacter sediminis TaxID=2218621 RepID=UPI00138FBCD0|nr:DUF2975 domain-containing protein [Hymenobacter sediminis]